MADAVKFSEGSDGEWFIEGLILPYGGPVAGKDFTGTYFTKSTDFCEQWFPDGGRPGMYAHGFDETLGTSVVGREVKSWKDDKGVWLRAQLDKAHEYATEVKALVDQGAVALSSGAVDHLLKIAAKSGEIVRWPWVEWSIVPNPANPEAILYPVKSADASAHLAVVHTPARFLAVKSEASDDVMEALWARENLTRLLADEAGEGEEAQAAVIRRALALIDRFIAMETAEIGTPADVLASDAADEMLGYLSLKSFPTPQTLHDAAKAAGASCASGEAPVTPPAPVLAVTAGNDVEPVKAADLARLQELADAVAVRKARELLS